MKNLVLTVAVLGAMTVATGCTTLGNVSATWQLQDWDDAHGQPTTAACPAGADTAIVYALPDGDTNLADADKDLFDCAAGAGTTAGHIAGSYQVWVAITDHSGATLFAQSNYNTVSISDGTNTPLSFAFQVNRGYVAAEWTLMGGTSHAAVACNANTKIEMDNMVGTSTPISDQFDCSPQMNTADPLPINTYAVALQAVDTGSPPLGLGPAASAGTADLQFGNQLIDKGSVVLTIDGQ